MKMGYFKGYFSFLIVFAACLLTLSLIQFNINAKYSNSADSIWVERYYQAEMNIKEAIVEAFREGAVEGIISYSEDYLISGCAESLAAGDESAAVPNIDCIKHHINKKTIEKINALSGQEANGMRFLVSIDQQYAVDEYGAACKPRPCGTPASSTSPKNQVVEIFNLDLGSLPLGSQSVTFEEGKKALNGVTLRIKRDEYTQQSPITVTIQNTGFDDVAFNMPPIEVGWG